MLQTNSIYLKCHPSSHITPPTYRKYKRIVQGEQTNTVKLKISLPVKELQRKGFHFVVVQVIAQHEGRFLLHYFMHNHGRLLGKTVGIAAQTQHQIGHDHRCEAPDHEQNDDIIQQTTLATHHKENFGQQEDAKNSDDKAHRHIGNTLRPIFGIGDDAQRKNFIVKFKQFGQIAFRGGSKKKRKFP